MKGNMRNNALKEEAGKGKAKSGLREGYSAKAINKAERKKDLQKESSALSILHQHNKQLHKGPRFLANSLSLHSISLSIAYRFALNRAQTPPLDVLSCHSLSRPGLLRSLISRGRMHAINHFGLHSFFMPDKARCPPCLCRWTQWISANPELQSSHCQ